MKTEHREHPLGTSGLTVRLKAETGPSRRGPESRLGRLLQWIARVLDYRTGGPH